MSTFPLPARHHREMLTSSSPAVVLGRACPITGEPLRAGDEAVICEATPGADPICIDGWRTVAGCPHCGAPLQPATAYVPPNWSATPWAAPPAPPAPERRPLSLLGPLSALLLLGALAIAVAALVFFLRTRPAAEPAVDATATPTVAPSATVALASPTPLPGALPSSTPPPSKTPMSATPLAPTPTLIVSVPTVPSPTATVPTPVPPELGEAITALILIDPSDDSPIRALRANDTVDLSEIGRSRLNVRAETSSAVESVTFLIDGAPFCPRGNCVENAPPYYMGGDQAGDAYDDWNWGDLLGDHTLTAIACTGDGGTGDCFPPVEVRLTIRR